MRFRRVEGGTPKASAAPPLPAINPLVISTTSEMCSLSASASVHGSAVASGLVTTSAACDAWFTARLLGRGVAVLLRDPPSARDAFRGSCLAGGRGLEDSHSPLAGNHPRRWRVRVLVSQY